MTSSFQGMLLGLGLNSPFPILLVVEWWPFSCTPLFACKLPLGWFHLACCKTHRRQSLLDGHYATPFIRGQSLCDRVICSTKLASPWSMPCSLTWLWQRSLKYSLSVLTESKSCTDCGRDLSQMSNMISFLAKHVEPSAISSMVASPPSSSCAAGSDQNWARPLRGWLCAMSLTSLSGDTSSAVVLVWDCLCSFCCRGVFSYTAFWNLMCATGWGATFSLGGRCHCCNLSVTVLSDGSGTSFSWNLQCRE